MKHIRAIFHIGILCLLVASSCKDTQNSDPKQEPVALIQEDAIPEDAIPFHYSNDSIKIILIDAVLNGTDSITLMWDTGTSCLIAPLAYKSRLKEIDSIHLKLGNHDIAYKGKIHFSDLYFNSKGENRIIGNHHLFEDKIVQISYDRKYIRILGTTDGLKDYERIPYRVLSNGYLYVSLILSIQGKLYHIKNARLDSGFNGAFITKRESFPDLDISGAVTRYNGYAGEEKKASYQIPTDSIRIGSISATDMEIYIAPDNNRIPDNLLGNGFFSHFSVVFDFKNQILYLKPLEQ